LFRPESEDKLWQTREKEGRAMSGLPLRILMSAWEAFFSAAPWVLFGLLVAGLLHAFLPAQLVRRAMGGNSLGAVLRAALIGAPLPLCSCGVIPTALYLRREGAGRGPVLSFMISTPETSIDSVGITYALMGPVMAAVRPVAALLSAVVAGLGERLLGAADPGPDPGGGPKPVPATDLIAGGQIPGGLCSKCAPPPLPDKAGAGRRGLQNALRYSTVVLMQDLAPWLILGLGLAGLIGALVPPDFIREMNLGGGLLPMVLIALVATPMYMCSTASTPIAAALVLKGLSPGAALVFLLVGPATNAATMTAVWRFLGRRSLMIYLASMVGTSFVLGLGLDFLARDTISAKVAELCSHETGTGALQWLYWACAIIMGGLLLNGLRIRLVPRCLAWQKARTTTAAVPPCGCRTKPGEGPQCCKSGEPEAHP
jgi:hypothetical protein